MQRFTNLLSIQFTQIFFLLFIYDLLHTVESSFVREVSMFVEFVGYPLHANLRLFERNKLMNCLAL